MRATPWIVLTLVSLAPPGCTRSGSAPPPAAGSADPVTLRVVDAMEYARVVAAEKGKVVLVDFWATWCGPCKKQFPDTVKLAEKYGPRGLAVISVSLDEPENQAKALVFLEQSGATFTNLLSRAGASAETIETFGLEGGSIPQYKVYARDGSLHQSFYQSPTVRFTHEDIERTVQELLGG